VKQVGFGAILLMPVPHLGGLPRVSVPSLFPQEVLQIHTDEEFRSPEFKRWWEPGLAAQHHDGPEEVL